MKEQLGVEIVLGELHNPIQVSIGQFYGIEINDFAVTVAKTALWIAEAQMMQETEGIVNMNLDFLPLKSYANIVEGNALRLDWNEVVAREKVDYIMGNPPFVGYAYQSKAQKEDLQAIYNAKNMDYVAGWYFKAAEFMAFPSEGKVSAARLTDEVSDRSDEQKRNVEATSSTANAVPLPLQGKAIRAAFVSTNSITQGEQVAVVWKPLIEQYGIHIDFAHRTFRWDSESNDKAAVHVVIIGFSMAGNEEKRKLYAGNQEQFVDNISPYLVDAPTVFIERRATPIVANIPQMTRGSQPTDNGNFILTKEERDSFIKTEPATEKFLRPFMMGKDFIDRKPRYCLWLVNASPSELKKSSRIMSRVQAVRDFRLASKKEATRKKADTSTLFDEIRQPTSDYIAVPKVSSAQRRYIPIDYLTQDVIAGDMLFTISESTPYHFGVLTSNVHMAWMRLLAGRLKSDYRYSVNIIYNNFPWPTPTDAQTQSIEQTAQAILDARAKFPDASLADLYDETTMPPDLRKAHQANDRAVMAAYGFDVKISEAECVARLMEMYQALAK